MVIVVWGQKRIPLAFGRDLSAYNILKPHVLSVKLSVGSLQQLNKAQVCPGHVHALSQFCLPRTVTSFYSLSWGYVFQALLVPNSLQVTLGSRLCVTGLAWPGHLPLCPLGVRLQELLPKTLLCKFISDTPLASCRSSDSPYPRFLTYLFPDFHFDSFLSSSLLPTGKPKSVVF